MAKSSITIKDTDKGWAELQHRLLKLSQSGSYVLVGVQGQEAAANHNNAKMTIAQLASVHEFGKVIHHPKSGRTTVIPERSFIRAGIDQFKEAIQKRATLVGTGVMLLKFDVDTALELLGQYAVGVIKQRIADGILPLNRPYTIARKGSSKPLIDRGQLRNSITHKAEGT